MERDAGGARSVLAAALVGRISIAWEGPRLPLLLTGAASIGRLLSLSIGTTRNGAFPSGDGAFRGVGLGTIPLRVAV